jgi:ATP-dependent DNA helicase RecG
MFTFWSCAPGYLTDCLLRRENLDRYDDRLTVTTNLIEAYDQITKFIAEYTMDRFFLIGVKMSAFVPGLPVSWSEIS